MCPHRRRSCSRLTGSTKLEGVYEGGTGETGGPLRGILNRKKVNFKQISIIINPFNRCFMLFLASTKFQSFQPFQQVFLVLFLLNCQDIWMIFATPRKRSKVFSRRPTWMVQARGVCLAVCKDPNQSSGW